MSQAKITVLDLRSMAWLLLGLTACIAPHLLNLPIWIAIVALAIGGWRWFAAKQGRHLANDNLKILLTIIVVGSIFLNYGTLVGRDAGVSLLILMMGLKLLELRQRRDVFVLLFLCYFILSTHFLFAQTIATASYVMLTAWLILGLHIHLTTRKPQPIRQPLKAAGIIMVQALPLMLAMFVLFPRLPGPIWSLPKDAYAGMTGLSDTMSPGGISQLSQSDEVAFRVKFDGEAPPADKRYWRGVVMWDTDGRNWGQGPSRSMRSHNVNPFTSFDSPISYTVTLEPHNKNWLFVLDLANANTPHGQFDQDFQLRAYKPVQQRLQYQMTSYINYNTGAISPIEQRLGLRLPGSRNPQTQALGKQLALSALSDNEIVNWALQMFNQQAFIYSLTPPRLGSNDPTDEFLFTTQKGFCEHFSSAFVTLMRAANIPARVVTGYLGGELNSVDDYYIVRQRDAHAWAEVWLPNQGWVRVDPTAAVAPERIESGINIGDNGEILFNIGEEAMLVELWQHMQLNIDAINNRWNQWVLGYGPEQQAQFLHNLGIDIGNWRDLLAVLVSIVGGLFVIISLLILLPKNRNTDPLLNHYQRFCRKLAKRKIIRLDNESASDFGQRAGQSRPDLKIEIKQITELYSQLRYAQLTSPEQLKKLKQLISQFKP